MLAHEKAHDGRRAALFRQFAKLVFKDVVRTLKRLFDTEG